MQAWLQQMIGAGLRSDAWHWDGDKNELTVKTHLLGKVLSELSRFTVTKPAEPEDGLPVGKARKYVVHADPKGP